MNTPSPPPNSLPDPVSVHTQQQPQVQEGEIQLDLELDLDLDDPNSKDSATTNNDEAAQYDSMDASPSSPSGSQDASSSSDAASSDSEQSDASDDDDDDDFLRAISGMDADEDDDEDAESGTKPGEALRTAHEIATPPIAPVDNVTITPDMPLEVAGHIHMIVQDQVIILASQPGDQRVLDDGTVLVLDDRSVLGRLFETFGPVAKPMFSVRFASPADIDKQRVVKGKVVYYVPDLSVWALTDQLRQMRGCDASNAFDEEVGDKEMEFSDDEEEARWRKHMKTVKASSRNGMHGGPQYEANDVASPRKRPRQQQQQQQQPYNGAGDVFDYGYDVSGVGRGRGGRHPPIASAMHFAAPSTPAPAPRPPQSGPSIDDLFSRYTAPTSSSAPAPASAPTIKREHPPPSRHIQHQHQHRQPPQQPRQQDRPQLPVMPATSYAASPAVSHAPAPPVFKQERPSMKLEGPPVNAQSLFTNSAPVSHLGRVPPPVGGPAPPAAGFAQLSSFTGAAALPPRPSGQPPPPPPPKPQQQQPSIWSSVTSPPPLPRAPPATAAPPAASPQPPAAAATDPNLVQLLQTMQAMQAMQSQLVAQLVSLGGTVPGAPGAAAGSVPQALDLSALLAGGGGGGGANALGSLLQQQQPQPAPELAPAPAPAYHPASMMVQNPPVYSNAWERSGGRVRVMAPGVLGVRSEADEEGGEQVRQPSQQQQGSGSIWKL